MQAVCVCFGARIDNNPCANEHRLSVQSFEDSLSQIFWKGGIEVKKN